AALALAGRVLQQEKYTESAKRALEFVLDHMMDEDYSLSHAYARGEVLSPGTLDDYAFLVWGLIELYETTLLPRYLTLAHDIMNRMLEVFDRGHGGLVFAPQSKSQLPTTVIDAYDGAIPSGNSIAAVNAARLSLLLQDDRFMKIAKSILEYFGRNLERNPTSHTALLIALDLLAGPSYNVTVVGHGPASSSILRGLQTVFLPHVALLSIADSDSLRELSRLSSAVAQHDPGSNGGVAFVCGEGTCYPPVENVDVLVRQLVDLTRRPARETSHHDAKPA
ncbi:MAG: hypothetical protein ACP6IT_09690, partial [Candidatus Thorarchaeota archaeon]